MIDYRYWKRNEPTITLYEWGNENRREYWHSAFEPQGLPSRRFYEPIEDEL
jgi:hypothetical protein